MKAQQTESSTAQSSADWLGGLPPFPSGWFAVAFSHELPAGGVLARRFMGQDLVVFRTRSGLASAVDAYCPHLGAHLGYGGSVEGESIQCPFHGFRFDRSGACVATGYGTPPPPRARLRAWPLQEVNGAILLRHDGDGQPVDWHVPQVDLRGWTPPLTRTFRLRTHPQDTTENGADLGHLAWTHRYRNVEVLSDLVADGPRLTARYAMTRSVGLLGRAGATPRTEFTIQIHGLGYSTVEASIPDFDLTSRYFVMTTPTDAGWADMRVAQRLKPPRQLGRVRPALALMPRGVATALLARLVFSGFLHDLQQDFVMWEHKRYVSPPVLARGDGPLGRFRQWTRQFYPGSRFEVGGSRFETEPSNVDPRSSHLEPTPTAAPPA